MERLPLLARSYFGSLVEYGGKESMMEEEVHKSTDDARAGSTPHIVRYVLTVSLTLALLAMIVLFLWGTTQS